MKCRERGSLAPGMHATQDTSSMETERETRGSADNRIIAKEVKNPEERNLDTKMEKS